MEPETFSVFIFIFRQEDGWHWRLAHKDGSFPDNETYGPFGSKELALAAGAETMRPPGRVVSDVIFHKNLPNVH